MACCKFASKGVKELSKYSMFYMLRTVVSAFYIFFCGVNMSLWPCFTYLFHPGTSKTFFSIINAVFLGLWDDHIPHAGIDLVGNEKFTTQWKNENAELPQRFLKSLNMTAEKTIKGTKIEKRNCLLSAVQDRNQKMVPLIVSLSRTLLNR